MPGPSFDINQAFALVFNALNEILQVPRVFMAGVENSPHDSLLPRTDHFAQAFLFLQNRLEHLNDVGISPKRGSQAAQQVAGPRLKLFFSRYTLHLQIRVTLQPELQQTAPEA